MKKTIFTLAVVTFVLGTLMMSCKPSTKEEKESQERVQIAREGVQEAEDTLVMAKRAATEEEWKAFKKEKDSIINDNNYRIAELKREMKLQSKSIDAKYQKTIADMEQKNKDLKVKTDTFKNDANSDWQAFKREFNHDMDEIGQAFKDLSVDNKK